MGHADVVCKCYNYYWTTAPLVVVVVIVTGSTVVSSWGPSRRLKRGGGGGGTVKLGNSSCVPLCQVMFDPPSSLRPKASEKLVLRKSLSL